MHNVILLGQIKYNSITLCMNMTPTKIHTDEIVSLLKENKVLRTDEIMKMIGCAPRTLYQKLSPCDYRSSINKGRRFFTLEETIEFNTNGLWEYEGIVFSKWGGVKETIIRLVSSSKMGLTPTQFHELLKTTITPQLIECVKQKKVIRVRFGRNQVYFSADNSIAEKQIERRKKHLLSQKIDVKRRKKMEEKTSFEIENVHFGFLAQLLFQDAITAEDIYLILDGMGKPLERREIKEIIIRHDLDIKKTRLELMFKK